MFIFCRVNIPEAEIYSTLPDDVFSKYKPTPYTFRVPKSSNIANELTVGYARPPPFYVQLDHTLAVIWSLFSPETMEKPLGNFLFFSCSSIFYFKLIQSFVQYNVILEE